MPHEESNPQNQRIFRWASGTSGRSKAPASGVIRFSSELRRSRLRFSLISNPTKNSRSHQRQTQATASNGKCPFGKSTLSLKTTSQHHHPAFPSVLLIKRKNVCGSQQVVHKAEAGSAG